MEHSLQITCPEWALGLLHFLLFPHDCVWLQERNVAFIHESFWNQRWPPSKDMYSGQSHAQNYFLYLSSPSSSERSLSMWEVASEKSFYCCSVKGWWKWRIQYGGQQEASSTPINSVFIRNKFMAFCSQSKNKWMQKTSIKLFYFTLGRLQ